MAKDKKAPDTSNTEAESKAPVEVEVKETKSPEQVKAADKKGVKLGSGNVRIDN